MPKRILFFLIAATIPGLALPATASAQTSLYADEELAEMSFAEWVESLEGVRSRPNPEGPIVLEFTVGSNGRDQRTRGEPRSFSRWCEMHGGAGAYTPKADVWMLEVFRTGVPYSAYGQTALRRDAGLLELPDEDGEAEWYFTNCSDGGLEGLGTFQFVMANRCFRNRETPREPYVCRALVYDERAMSRLREIVDPAFAVFYQARRETAAAEAESIRVWREGIEPGDYSHLGLVVEVNGSVARVQDRFGQTRWFRVDELEPGRR